MGQIQPIGRLIQKGIAKFRSVLRSFLWVIINDNHQDTPLSILTIFKGKMLDYLVDNQVFVGFYPPQYF